MIGVEKGGKVRPAGLIEFPPPPDARKAVWSIAEQGNIGEDKDFIYLDPQIRMKVKSRVWTKRGMIRIPVFESFLFGDQHAGDVYGQLLDQIMDQIV